MEYRHTPVMLTEVIEYLDPKPNENFIDCTFGGGGYTEQILSRIKPNGKVLAIDLDKLSIKHGKTKFNKNKNLILINDNFSNLFKITKNIWPDKQSPKFSGIVFDLGLSQAQLEDRSRGFSFKLDAPLIMNFEFRIPNSESLSTEVIVNKWPQVKLEHIIKEYGEERFAKNIALNIAKSRKLAPIKTTRQLVEIISKSIPGRNKRSSKIHFATRTFQALRIATNKELDNLGEALPRAVDLLIDKGRIVVVSYHSLEDRIVKNYFKKESKDCICPPATPECRCGHKAKLRIITKKILTPTKEEVRLNPKSRSAKMRVAEKI